jgi:hypothetical protein
VRRIFALEIIYFGNTIEKQEFKLIRRVLNGNVV